MCLRSPGLLGHTAALRFPRHNRLSQSVSQAAEAAILACYTHRLGRPGTANAWVPIPALSVVLASSTRRPSPEECWHNEGSFGWILGGYAAAEAR